MSRPALTVVKLRLKPPRAKAAPAHLRYKEVRHACVVLDVRTISWGSIFRQLDAKEITARVRVQNLVEYVKSIQVTSDPQRP